MFCMMMATVKTAPNFQRGSRGRVTSHCVAVVTMRRIQKVDETDHFQDAAHSFPGAEGLKKLMQWDAMD
jgi:hypothetical protein